ncbi:DNA circularization N-terminal domain-containing protein [Chelatococcus reniformis]|uniref:DNA circulation N-terminal domain-containing protein n=1 Tax=Chelatococcus reniformis TaxID=1494448 RepID=A0A916XG49_9HYPH|nr:DNA circularization N-terminal domain-containing protein [Chelatococcus reniformis]GGC70845.1 hypothetical protein GCM10010994_31780 [Chelatococcus reniformis]
MWRDRLRPASFRGAQFHVEAGVRASGRRIAMHEYAKRDDPYAEDLGRRARRHPISAYLVGADYQAPRDQLIDALEREGAGMLVHPTLGSFRVVCGGYSVRESRERGGFCEFDIEFLESGSTGADRFFEDTAANVVNKSDDAAAAAAGRAGEDLTK